MRQVHSSDCLWSLYEWADEYYSENTNGRKREKMLELIENAFLTVNEMDISNPVDNILYLKNYYAILHNLPIGLAKRIDKLYSMEAGRYISLSSRDFQEKKKKIFGAFDALERKGLKNDYLRSKGYSYGNDYLEAKDQLLTRVFSKNPANHLMRHYINLKSLDEKKKYEFIYKPNSEINKLLRVSNNYNGHIRRMINEIRELDNQIKLYEWLSMLIFELIDDAKECNQTDIFPRTIKSLEDIKNALENTIIKSNEKLEKKMEEVNRAIGSFVLSNLDRSEKVELENDNVRNNVQVSKESVINPTYNNYPTSGKLFADTMTEYLTIDHNLTIKDIEELQFVSDKGPVSNRNFNTNPLSDNELKYLELEGYTEYPLMVQIRFLAGVSRVQEELRKLKKNQYDRYDYHQFAEIVSLIIREGYLISSASLVEIIYDLNMGELLRFGKIDYDLLRVDYYKYVYLIRYFNYEGKHENEVVKLENKLNDLRNNNSQIEEFDRYEKNSETTKCYNVYLKIYYCIYRLRYEKLSKEETEKYNEELKHLLEVRDRIVREKVIDENIINQYANIALEDFKNKISLSESKIRGFDKDVSNTMKSR